MPQSPRPPVGSRFLHVLKDRSNLWSPCAGPFQCAASNRMIRMSQCCPILDWWITLEQSRNEEDGLTDFAQSPNTLGPPPCRAAGVQSTWSRGSRLHLRLQLGQVEIGQIGGGNEKPFQKKNDSKSPTMIKIPKEFQKKKN